MKHPLRSLRARSILVLASAGALSLLLAGCSEGQAAADGAGDAASAASAPVQDAPLAAWQVELLETARRSASAIPLAPHVKDRSRAQEAVVTACLALDQPQRALAAAGQIENWRRGTGYAGVAAWAAEHGRTAEAERLLKLAQGVAEHAESGADGEGSQGWRKDRVRAAIGRTYLLLGRQEEAAPFLRASDETLAGAAANAAPAAGAPLESATDVPPTAGPSARAESTAGREAAARAEGAGAAGPADVEAQLEELDAAVAAGGFDRIHDGLEACAGLFDRFYAEASLRARAEDAVKGAWKKLPVAIGIDLLGKLADAALRHEDPVKALALVEEAQQLVDGRAWIPEDAVPLQARLAALRHRAGEQDAARRQIDAALALFDAEHLKIANVFRAGALRPVAEALQSMGDTAGARAVYRRAIQEGFVNPNSRPRAEDLSATCLSMAVHGVEPDAALTAEIGRMSDALGPPW
ncbi:MAG TPA: hypothetical protein VK824_07725 [Planctomycetota bacterium]|nr:hypothetical protein [Planctomycetota bacterium]